MCICKVQNTKEGKDQESIQSSTTLVPGYQWESDNITNKSQELSPFPAGSTRHQETDVHESITKQDRN